MVVIGPLTEGNKRFIKYVNCPLTVAPQNILKLWNDPNAGYASISVQKRVNQLVQSASTVCQCLCSCARACASACKCACV